MADTWMREFQEAVRLVEDVKALVAERGALPAHSSEGIRIASVARRKLAMLGNKVERLEAQARVGKVDGREGMVAEVRDRAKQMAAALSSAHASRSSLLEGGAAAPVETSRTKGLDNSGLVNLQRQIMREQDQDLESLEHTVLSTKHIALAVNEELDLHTRLLDDMDQSADVTNNKLLAAQRRLGFLNKNLGQGWSLATMILLMIVVVALVLVLFKLL